MSTATDLRNFPAVEENVERPETLSQTLLAKHDKCPRAGYFTIRDRYGKSSIPMDRGSAFHEVVEKATLLLIEQGEPMMPGEVAKDLADATMREHPEWVLPTAEQDAVRLMAWNWAEATVLELDKILGVEIPLEVELGGFTLTCRIDRAECVGNDLYLYDYKTSLNVRRREELQRGFQGQFYALAMLYGYHQETGETFGSGIQSVTFSEVYPRYRRDDGTLASPEGAWTRSELHEFRVSLERNVEALERSLGTGDWPARDGSWCGECPAPQECPIPEHLREVPHIETAADAEAAFSHKLALDKEGRRLQAGMREFVKRSGRPIFVGDLAFDASYSESRSVKDWDGFMEAVRHAVEHNVELKLEDHVQVRGSTKFAKRKQTEEELTNANSNGS